MQKLLMLGAPTEALHLGQNRVILVVAAHVAGLQAPLTTFHIANGSQGLVNQRNSFNKFSLLVMLCEHEIQLNTHLGVDVRFSLKCAELHG